MGLDSHYSGTIGAAREGQIFNIPSIAFSRHYEDKGIEIDYDLCAQMSVDIFNRLLKIKTPNTLSPLMYSVNFPNMQESNQAHRARWTRLSQVGNRETPQAEKDADGNIYYRLPYSRRKDQPDKLSDGYAVLIDKCTSITAIHLDGGLHRSCPEKMYDPYLPALGEEWTL